ncbi:hypothetical protein Bbelb_057310 [Branchiostoma belcheri]|nr:hypothetical protein Bbelb_057310 [Branchiostoma belcheri]
MGEGADREECGQQGSEILMFYLRATGGQSRSSIPSVPVTESGHDPVVEAGKRVGGDPARDLQNVLQEGTAVNSKFPLELEEGLEGKLSVLEWLVTGMPCHSL